MENILIYFYKFGNRYFENQRENELEFSNGNFEAILSRGVALHWLLIGDFWRATGSRRESVIEGVKRHIVLSFLSSCYQQCSKSTYQYLLEGKYSLPIVYL